MRFSLLLKLFTILLLVALFAEMGVVWLSGEKETRDALESGRRLIILLDSGEVQGKILSASPAPEAEKPEAEKPVPEQPNDEKKPEAQDGQALPTKTEEASKNAEKTPDSNAEVVSTIAAPQEDNTPLEPLAKSSNPTAEFSTDLVEKSEFGVVPKIGKGDKKPWKHYSKKFDLSSSKQMIAIVVSDLGNNQKTTDMALRLPENISLSFSPYSKNLKEFIDYARVSGHEVLLNLPMEASNYPASDPGSLALMVSQNQEGNEKRLTQIMSQNFGYIGLLTPQDEVFSANTEIFKSLLKLVGDRGLALIIGKPPVKSETSKLIATSETANAVADTWVDEELTETAIEARLTLLEQTAKQNGYALGIARAYPITLKLIAKWVNGIEERGFTLVPASAIIGKK